MDGIIPIEKEKGYTSHDVVAIVKKMTKEKVGHTGTLDPQATGVLPLLVGKATKISKYLIDHDKVYEAVLQLGKKTDTADGEGTVLEEENVVLPSYERIQKVFEEMLGEIEQVPPLYSAIKVKGKKLYEYARKGQEVEVEPRKVTIYHMALQNVEQTHQQIYFTVHCSKGTYIRTLCEQIAHKLGTIGYMKELRRTRVGKFDLADSVTMEQLKKEPERIQDHLITIEEWFQEQEKIVLSNSQMEKLLHGVALPRKGEDGLYRLYHEDGRFIGLVIQKQGMVKRDIILEE